MGGSHSPGSLLGSVGPLASCLSDPFQVLLTVVQRFIGLSCDPQMVQQDGEFTSHRHHGSLLRTFSSSGSDPLPIASQVTIRAKRSQDVLGTTDHHFANKPIASFRNPQLRILLSGLVLSLGVSPRYAPTWRLLRNLLASSRVKTKARAVIGPTPRTC